MLNGVDDGTTREADRVELVVTGTPVAGEYHCTECGYGVTVHDELPRCPMCGGESWEQASWSPLSRALERQ